jgi:hypothetical protein
MIRAEVLIRAMEMLPAEVEVEERDEEDGEGEGAVRKVNIP